MLDQGNTEELTNYVETLNKQWGDVPKDVVLPAGAYRLKLKKAKKVEPQGEDESFKPRYMYQIVEPCEDVDAEAFAAIPKKDIDALTLFYTPWMSNGNDYRQMTEHLLKHGVNISKAKDRWEALEIVSQAQPEIIGYVEPVKFTYKRGPKAGQIEDRNELKEFAPVRR